MKLIAVMIGVLALPALAPAQFLWNELSQGDLSDDHFAPNSFVLSPGDNTLFGTIDGDDGEGNIDRDYFSITIPSGLQLSQLVLAGYDSTDFAAFMGIQPGPIFPDDPKTVAPGDLMGWTLFGQSLIGQDLLPEMGIHGYGFTPPLSSGVFTFWVQQLDTFTEWTGDFVVTEVPEPSAAALLLIALAHTARRRARCQRPLTA
jgi:hypothetical protein